MLKDDFLGGPIWGGGGGGMKEVGHVPLVPCKCYFPCSQLLNSIVP